MLQLAFCVLLSAGLLLELMPASMELAGRARVAALRAPLRDGLGRARASASCCSSRLTRRRRRRRRGRGGAARALRRRAARGRARRRWTPTPGAARADEAAPGDCSRPAAPRADLPQALAAIDLALWDLRGQRDGRPVAALLAGAPARGGRGQRDDRRARTGPARPRRRPPPRAPASRCVKVKVGVGDDAGPRRGRARGGRARTSRCASTPTARGRRGGGRGDRARSRRPGSSWSRSPCHGVDGAARGARGGRGAGSRWTRPAAEPGALLSGAGRRRVPEDRALRRDLRRCCARQRRCARPAPRSTSPRPSTGRSGSPRRSTPPRRCAPPPPCGLATLDLFEGLDDPLPACGPHRRAHRPGARCVAPVRAQVTSRRRPGLDLVDEAAHASPCAG